MKVMCLSVLWSSRKCEVEQSHHVVKQKTTRNRINTLRRYSKDPSDMSWKTFLTAWKSWWCNNTMMVTCAQWWNNGLLIIGDRIFWSIRPWSLPAPADFLWILWVMQIFLGRLKSSQSASRHWGHDLLNQSSEFKRSEVTYLGMFMPRMLWRWML